MDYKGQFNMNGLIAVIIGLVMLVALLPVADSLVGAVLLQNLSNLQQTSVIYLLVGLSGLFMILMWVMSIFNAQSQPQQM